MSNAWLPRQKRFSALAKAVKGIADKFCGGSLERMLLGLVEAILGGIGIEFSRAA
jgi:hypothetical protein